MEHQEPTSSELLHSFIEGELEASLEPSLFADLSSQSELRAEMRDLLALQRAVKKDRAALVPPVASTAAVFGALGMSTSLLVNSGWLGSLWSKIWLPLATAVVSGAVTWYAVSPPSTSAQQTSAQTTQITSKAPTAEPSEASSPIHDTVVITKTVVVHDHTDMSRLASTIVSHSSDSPVIASTAAATSSSASGSESTTSTTTSAAVSSSSVTSAATPSKQRDGELIENTPSVEAYPATIMVRRVNAQSLLPATEVVNGTRELPHHADFMSLFTRRFSTTVRAISASSYVDVNDASTDGAGFNNIALGVYYTFSPWLGAGMELGREPFAMSFRGITDGTLKKYESVQDLLWGSAQVQLYPFPSLLERGWQPFFQFNGGFTNYGMLAKGIVGTTYAPTTNLRMMFGFEATGLFYTVQGTSYTTPKLGFTYGIGYQL